MSERYRPYVKGAIGVAVALVLWHWWLDHVLLHTITGAINGLAANHPELFTR